MSIIFKKLENLKTSSTGPEELQSPKLNQGRSVYTFRKLLFSPRGVLIVFAVIALFGIITFYFLSFLKNSLDAGSSKAIVVQQAGGDSNILSDSDKPPREEDSPPSSQAPFMGTGLQDQPGVRPDPKQKTSQAQEQEEFKIPEYYVYKPEKKKTFDHMASSDNIYLNLPAQTRSEAHVKESDPQTERKLKKQSVKQEEKSIKSNKTLSKEENIQKEALRAAKQKRTDNTSDIATLGTRITDAFENNDTARMDTLLAMLAQKKGKNSAYYLRLLAFRQIEHKNYNAARQLLNRVLAKDKTDFVAGFNMAVIEIRQQKTAEARQRLIRLKELYPSKSAIDDLLDRLQ